MPTIAPTLPLPFSGLSAGNAGVQGPATVQPALAVRAPRTTRGIQQREAFAAAAQAALPALPRVLIDICGEFALSPSAVPDIAPGSAETDEAMAWRLIGNCRLLDSVEPLLLRICSRSCPRESAWLECVHIIATIRGQAGSDAPVLLRLVREALEKAAQEPGDATGLEVALAIHFPADGRRPVQARELIDQAISWIASPACHGSPADRDAFIRHCRSLVEFAGAHERGGSILQALASRLDLLAQEVPDRAPWVLKAFCFFPFEFRDARGNLGEVPEFTAEPQEGSATDLEDIARSWVANHRAVANPRDIGRAWKLRMMDIDGALMGGRLANAYLQSEKASIELGADAAPSMEVTWLQFAELVDAARRCRPLDANRKAFLAKVAAVGRVPPEIYDLAVDALVHQRRANYRGQKVEWFESALVILQEAFLRSSGGGLPGDRASGPRGDREPMEMPSNRP